MPTGYQEQDGLCKIKALGVQKAHGNGVVVANDNLAPCPGDTWVVLNTAAQGWRLDRLTAVVTGERGEAFTLRASWAASVRSVTFSPNARGGARRKFRFLTTVPFL